MKKQLEANGNKLIVKEILTDKKNKTKVTFTNGKSLILSDESFLLYYLYPGKELTNEEYTKLVSKNSLASNESYIKNLISKKNYSSNELVHKLMAVKHLSYQESNAIILELIKQGLIDDANYSKNIALELSNKGYSSDGIKNYLLRKGVNNSIIEQVLKNNDNNSSFIMPYIQKVINKNSHNSYLVTIQNIKVELYKKGYSQEESNRIIDECKFKFPYLTSNEREYLALLEESKKYYDKILKLDSSPYDKLNKFKKHLLSKGFRLEDIENLIRKEGYDFD